MRQESKKFLHDSSRYRPGLRVNEEVVAPMVRLVREDGVCVSIVTRQEALLLASNVDLDLVEVSPNESPPVCRLVNYSKYKFRLQRKRRGGLRSKRGNSVKEIKLRPTIEEHDYQTKLRSVRKFLKQGMRVKVFINFKGREVSHVETGMEHLTRLVSDIGSLGQTEVSPKLEGRVIGMVIKPT